MVKGRQTFVLGIAFSLLAVSAYADESGLTPPGQAHSTSFTPLTPGAAIAIRPLDDSNANLTLSRHFAAALRKRSLAVQTMPAPVVLNFGTEVDQTIRRDYRSATGANGLDRGLLRYVLTATLDDERTGRRLWQGEAIYTGAPADEATTLAAMAAILAEQVGQTVRQRSFRLE